MFVVLYRAISTAINNSEETFYTVSGWVFVEDIPNNDPRSSPLALVCNECRQR
jgi:hypothetical protein